MVVRVRTAGASALLDGANLLFVPIFNVDGLSALRPRINQRGPAGVGLAHHLAQPQPQPRYTKLDAPEMRAMVRALDQWDPDLRGRA
jgi:murein tripeptide amidase MpaA